MVGLDDSRSWLRGGADAAWITALRRAGALHPDSVLLFGDSVRPREAEGPPADRASTVGPLVDRVAADGIPVTLLTDGELDDPKSLERLPAGSRVEVVARAPRPDAALLALAAPAGAVAGDTLRARVEISAGGAGSAPGRVQLLLDGRPLATEPLGALAPQEERSLSLTGVLPSAAGPRLLQAVVSTPSDAEPANDTLGASLEIAPAAAAVFLSTAPDQDARYVLDVLRGALALPVRGYLLVAPGRWRSDATLGAVAEAEVRRAVREAPMLVLHGDTAVFGPPRAATRAPLALLVPPAAVGGEWYAASAPPSPLAPALAGTPWDSLPPIDVGAPPRGKWVGLEAALGRQGARRGVVAGDDAPRRVVVVAAAGFWRWKVHGGRAADAFSALWGGIFDWLAAERPDARDAVPEGGTVREGDVIRWRRAAGDSSATVVLARRSAGARPDTVRLAFRGATATMETAPLAAGVYDVREHGGAALLVVNVSRELLPRRPVVASGAFGRAPAASAPRRGARDAGWLYLVAVLALVVEWLLRRRLGLR